MRRCQKVPNFDFQSQFFLFKIEKYQFRSTVLLLTFLYYQNDRQFLTVSSDLKLHNRYCHNQGYCIIPFCIFFVNLYASLIICVSQIDLEFVIILQDIFWEYEFLGSSNLKIDNLCVVRHIFYALKNKLKLYKYFYQKLNAII
jgi:hypothetical protein